MDTLIILANKIKDKYVPKLHDQYDQKMIDAMLEFSEIICKKYQNWILEGYKDDSTILELLGTDDVLNDFLYFNK